MGKVQAAGAVRAFWYWKEGWKAFANLLKSVISNGAGKGIPSMDASKEHSKRWYQETLFIACQHNSKLSWGSIQESLKVKLYPFSKIKALASYVTKMLYKAWLQKGTNIIQSEKIYFNAWSPACNIIKHDQKAWFKIFGMPFTHWTEAIGKIIGEELGTVVEIDPESVKGSTQDSVSLWARHSRHEACHLCMRRGLIICGWVSGMYADFPTTILEVSGFGHQFF